MALLQGEGFWTVLREIDARPANQSKAAGYQYINLDDCWAEPTRDSKGNLVVNKTLFYAIVLFNRNTTAANIKVNWSSIGLSGSLTVRDLWAHTNKGSFTGSYTANVAGRGVVMLKVTK